MFEQTFKNIDDVLWKESGCTTELDYTEQTSWLLFLKYLDDLEQERAIEAELAGKPYEFIIDEAHRWSAWAAPRQADGSVDRNRALIGDDLIDYVNRQLFPYLQGFKQRVTSPDTIEYKIGEIFSEIKNRFQSGYTPMSSTARKELAESLIMGTMLGMVTAIAEWLIKDAHIRSLVVGCLLLGILIVLLLPQIYGRYGSEPQKILLSKSYLI